MKTIKHEGRLLLSTATAAAWLLSGLGTSRPQAEAAPKAQARAGRYRLIFDNTAKTRGMKSSGPPYDIELKPNGQWAMNPFPIKGTYTIRGNVITFGWVQYRKKVKSTARLSKNGFAMPNPPLIHITTAPTVKNPRYVKVR